MGSSLSMSKMIPCFTMETSSSTIPREEFCPSSHLALTFFPHLDSSVSQGAVLGLLPFSSAFYPLASFYNLMFPTITSTWKTLNSTPMNLYSRFPYAPVYSLWNSMYLLEIEFDIFSSHSLFTLSLILTIPGNTKIMYYLCYLSCDNLLILFCLSSALIQTHTCTQTHTYTHFLDSVSLCSPG